MNLALLPAGLLLGLVAGCSHGRGNAPPTSQPATPMVTAEDIQRNSSEPIEELLMRRFPGITVTRTSDGGFGVRLRAPTSFGGGEPLYVVDGIKIQPGPNGTLTGLNPYDIQSIQVLTDAVSMVTYGGQAANGVIVIRTKRPPQ